MRQWPKFPSRPVTAACHWTLAADEPAKTGKEVASTAGDHRQFLGFETTFCPDRRSSEAYALTGGLRPHHQALLLGPIALRSAVHRPRTILLRSLPTPGHAPGFPRKMRHLHHHRGPDKWP